jgi:trk system potassium uptake protein TrkH
LLGAEAHKAGSERFSPGVFSSLRILWAIYASLTLICAGLLWAEGLSLFDAVAHALTTVSTGGFSTYDDSIGHFAAAGFRHATAIEYTILVFMVLGGTSFLIHWNVIRRRWRSVTHNSEFRAWLVWVFGAAALVAIAARAAIATVGVHEHVRASLFHVVSIATTTGFTTQDLTTPWFSPFTRQVFLGLMLAGGCVGSTAGGLKMLRLAVLAKLLRKQLRSASRSMREVIPLTLDGRLVAREEVERTASIAVAWMIAIAIIWLATTLTSRLGTWGSLSAAMSALGNVGPHFADPVTFAEIGPGVKVCYILAMVAGRLEILPFLLIFSRGVWR